ncbi:hypothetical protein BOO28_19120, partial [Vibrio navarrensis]|nr:hypothetical protein [Vibrio navarrensis]
ILIILESMKRFIAASLLLETIIACSYFNPDKAAIIAVDAVTAPKIPKSSGEKTLEYTGKSKILISCTKAVEKNILNIPFL